jgi:hypothetical protein
MGGAGESPALVGEHADQNGWARRIDGFMDSWIVGMDLPFVFVLGKPDGLGLKWVRLGSFCHVV